MAARDFTRDVRGTMPARLGACAGPLVEVWSHRHLLLGLAARDLRVRYKQTLLGAAWAVFVPAGMMAVCTVVFGHAHGGPLATASISAPYALFALTGLVPWTFFAGGLNACVNVLVANRGLITKVYFPREVLPLACLTSALVDFALALAFLFVLALAFSAGGAWSFDPGAALLMIPVVLAIQLTWMIGAGMMLAMANLFYRDVRQVFSVVLQVWMLATNVIYPLPTESPWMAAWARINPMIPLLDAYRDCILAGRSPDLSSLALLAAQALIILVAGWICFRRTAYLFAERI